MKPECLPAQEISSSDYAKHQRNALPEGMVYTAKNSMQEGWQFAYHDLYTQTVNPQDPDDVTTNFTRQEILIMGKVLFTRSVLFTGFVCLEPGVSSETQIPFKPGSSSFNIPIHSRLEKQGFLTLSQNPSATVVVDSLIERILA